MKHQWYVLWVGLIILMGIAIFIFSVSSPRNSPSPTLPLSSNSNSMKLTSTAFQPNGIIPTVYTCDGKGISPPLIFSDVPSNTQSLVLIMDDPDAPVGVWDHWVVFNIPPSVREVPEGKNPEGIVGNNTSGKNVYQPPCPPDREHRYVFKLYALDTTIQLVPGVTKKEVENAMQGHIIDSGELIGRYNRKR